MSTSSILNNNKHCYFSGLHQDILVLVCNTLEPLPSSLITVVIWGSRNILLTLFPSLFAPFLSIFLCKKRSRNLSCLIQRICHKINFYTSLSRQLMYSYNWVCIPSVSDQLLSCSWRNNCAIIRVFIKQCRIYTSTMVSMEFCVMRSLLLKNF